MSEPTPNGPTRRARRGQPKPPSSLPTIVCKRCGGPVMLGQHVAPLFSAKLVRWSEHPVLSKPPVIRGIISTDGSPGRVDMSLGDQLRQRAAMGGERERAELSAFESLLSKCLADALVSKLRKEAEVAEPSIKDLAMSTKEIDAALEHWSGYIRAKNALLEARVVRSFKAPEADFAEWLIANLIGGSLPPNKSHPACDVLAPGKRVQVKSLCKAPGNSNGYIIGPKDRSNDPATGASHYAFVFFNDFALDAAFLVPEDVVRLWRRTQVKRLDIEDHPSTVRLWPV
jgi:hypothetical protein